VGGVAAIATVEAADHLPWRKARVASLWVSFGAFFIGSLAVGVGLIGVLLLRH
jgi:hypothetical protein